MATDKPLRPFEIKLEGKLITGEDPDVIGNNFQSLKNMRYKGQDTNPIGIAGMTKINTRFEYDDGEQISCPVIGERWESVRCDYDTDALFACCEYDSKDVLVVKCELHKFYGQTQRYVVADSYLYLDQYHSSERQVLPTLAIDPDAGFVYCLTKKRLDTQWRVYKLNYSDLSYVTDVAHPGCDNNSPIRAFMYVDGSGDRWIISLERGYTSIKKFNADTLALDSTLGLPAADFYHASLTANTAWLVGSGGLNEVNLDTMSVVTVGAAVSNGSYIVLLNSGTFYVDRSTVGDRVKLYGSSDGLLICVGDADASYLIAYNGDAYGHETVGAGFRRFQPYCCVGNPEDENCDVEYKKWINRINPYDGLNSRAVYCREFVPENPSGNYGSTGGWIETITFPDCDFYAHQICTEES